MSFSDLSLNTFLITDCPRWIRQPVTTALGKTGLNVLMAAISKLVATLRGIQLMEHHSSLDNEAEERLIQVMVRVHHFMNVYIRGYTEP